MKPASLLAKNPIQEFEKFQTVAGPQRVVKSETAPSDAGIFFLLTALLVLIGRVMGSWILSEQVKIQKGPHEFVNRQEEYQNLHNTVGPNTFFRMY